MSDRRYINAPTAEIEAAGRALYGDAWQAGLASFLGWDKARLRAMLRGDRPMPFGALDEILTALGEQISAAESAAEDLKKAIGQ